LLQNYNATDMSKYFFQGFLFVFGLSSPPFMDEVQAEDRIDECWDRVAASIHRAFGFETSEKAK